MQSAMPEVVKVIFGNDQPGMKSGDVTATGEVVVRMDDLKPEHQQAIINTLAAA